MVMAQVVPPLLVSSALVLAFSIPLFLALVVLEMAWIGRMSQSVAETGIRLSPGKDRKPCRGHQKGQQGSGES